MTRLARSLHHLRPHYDVVVVGSGYGGGVAASRLARAGKRVAVLERGREFVTGEFPSRFPDLRGEMQLTGKRMRIGSATGLYDVRFGEDMHVLIGCGLGGGSLINAGVALRPDPRMFRDAVWPQEVTSDGLLYEFDYATFGADSVVGFKRREVESRTDDYATLGMPLAQVANMATRQVDWMRTGLVGGVILLGVLVGAYKASTSNSGGGESGGGTKPPPS